MAVKPIPEGFHAVTPYFVVEGASRLVEFLVAAFDGEVLDRMEGAGGVVMHAKLRVGDSLVMMGEAGGEWKAMPASIYLYVEDCDAVYRRALKAGATSLQVPADQFYGDRHGGVKDPCGNIWWIATHKEDVPPEEMERRAQAAMRQ